LSSQESFFLSERESLYNSDDLAAVIALLKISYKSYLFSQFSFTLKQSAICWTKFSSLSTWFL